MSDNNDLRGKIDQAKRRLPLPELMAQVGLGDRAKKTAHCPFHDDEHKSFSVFQGKDGWWHYKCFAGCGDGDEIMFLRKLRGLPLTEAMSLYLEMAGFPPSRPPKSHEYPQPRKSRESPGSPEYPESPVYPMSNGQGLDKGMEKDLKDLAARNACTRADDVPEKKRFKLARDVRAVEKRIGRELTTAELVRTCEEWELASVPFLGWDDDDDHLGMFLAELTKVRVPTGEGDTIRKALEAVSNLSASELPAIPGYADARESWRRLAALHRELFRLSGGKTYFLGCRDAAKVHPGLIHQTAYNINLALARLGVIKIVRVGDARENGRASKFRYLLSQGENGVEEDDGGLEI
jgi:CHC2-type zinc finger protein